MGDNDQGSQYHCFQRWINLQQQDLSELLQNLNLINNTDPERQQEAEEDHSAELSHLLDKNIRHFEEYSAQRATLARENVYPYFSPTWCTSLERSMLWVGGCRPSIFIRLVFALSGNEIISHFDEFLNGTGIGGIGDLSSSQIRAINNLQLKTIRDEDNLSRDLASLQEEMADQPIAILAKQSDEHFEPSNEFSEALSQHAVHMMGILEKGDGLRLSTMKELISILTQNQAVDFLAAAKKLHLCLHAWSPSKDHEHTRAE